MKRKMHLLIVEDEDNLRSLLHHALQAEFDLTVAETGEEALHRLAEKPLPDLVLLDVGLPGLDGFGVLKKLKSSDSFSSIPVIFLTGNTDDSDEARGLSMGAVDYIRKPVNLPLLMARIATHLDLKQHRDELETIVAHRTRKLEESEKKIRASLREKELLLQEIHHRVKNNLQIISSLLSLQAHYVQDPADYELFTESRDRIRSMALVHEELYRSGDFGNVNIKEYITKLTRELLGTIGGGKSIKTEIFVDDILFSIDIAIPCGLIINELVTNCLKHAFNETDQGTIEISIQRIENDYILTLQDDGSGFPEGLDYKNSDSLGMELVVNLVAQLKGQIALEQEGRGSKFIISFPHHECGI